MEAEIRIFETGWIVEGIETARSVEGASAHEQAAGAEEADIGSLSELLCVRHKLMAKEPRYATQTQGRSAGRTGQGLEPGPGTH
ncbi:hypothetical protein QZL99_26935, partial [Burkholderia multivorans]|nr:hypothetical protein [Burkholderia multivorans]